MKTFWPPKICLRRTTSITAGRLGFGMGAASNGPDPYAAAMTNFGEAHHATQTAVSNLTNSNAALATALPALQQHMAQQGQVLAMLCQQVNNAWQSNGNNWSNNGGGGGNSNNNGNRNANGGWRRNNNGGNNSNNNGGNNNSNSSNRSNNSNRNSNKRNGGNDSDRPWNVREWEGATYCWSHGHDTGPHHTSATCNNRLQGHQPNATSTNTMGGNPKNAQRTMNPSQVGRVGRRPPASFAQKQTQQWAASAMAYPHVFQQANQPIYPPLMTPMHPFAGAAGMQPTMQTMGMGMPTYFDSGASAHFMNKSGFM